MATSLAAQLAQIASHDAARLSSSRALTARDSYLFPARAAAQQDIHTIYSLGLNGFEELVLLDPVFSTWRAELFSDASKERDRLQEGKEENAQLDASIRTFLRRLGPHLLTRSAAKALEWLIRRFRINEFNSVDVLGTFMPYHFSPQFARMLQILKLDSHPEFAFLSAARKSTAPLARENLLRALLAPTGTTHSLSLLQFVSGLLLPSDIRRGGHDAGFPHAHQALVSFHTATLVEYLDRVTQGEGGRRRSLPEEAANLLLPIILEGMKVRSRPDIQIGCYMILAAFACSAELTSKAQSLILVALAASRPNPVRKTQLDALGAKDGLDEEASLQREQKDKQTSVALVLSLVAFCDAQNIGGEGSLPELPVKSVRSLLEISSLSDLLLSLWASRDLTPFIKVFLPALAASIEDKNAAALLSAVLISPSCPAAVARPNVAALLGSAPPSTEASDADRTRHLHRAIVLSDVRQHRFVLFDDVLKSSMADLGDEKKRQMWIMVQSAMSSQSLEDEDVSSGGDFDKDATLWLGAISADSGERALALKELLRSVEDGDRSAQEEFVVATVMSHLADPSVEVLNTLYEYPQVVLAVLPATTILSTILTSLESTSALASRAVLRAHLTFLSKSFVAAHPELVDEVARTAFFPRLLFTKPTARSAQAAWTAAKASRITQLGLLKGADDMALEEAETKGKMAATDLAIADALSDNILRTDKDARQSYIAFLISRAFSEDVDIYARLLAQLVLVAVAAKSPTTETPALALHILKALGKATSGFASVIDSADLVRGGNAIVNETVADAVIAKPRSFKTEKKLQARLLYLLATRLPASEGEKWLSSSIEEFDERMEAKLRLYVLANTPSTGLALSTALLRGLFASLRDKSITFLASIWTGSSQGVRQGAIELDLELRLVSLHHACAYLRAFVGTDSERQHDFQTIVPALLVALANQDRRIRDAALACLDTVAQIAGQESKGKITIFEYESIYGASSASVQYLDTADVKNYVENIASMKEAFASDADYLAILHSNTLAPSKKDSKKDAGYKRRVLFFILSHVVSWPNAKARLALLESLFTVRSSTKAAMLQPALQKLLKGNQDEALVLSTLTEVQRDAYLSALFDVFDRTARAALEEDLDETWTTFRSAISSSSDALLRKHACLALQRGTFALLSQSRKVEALRIVAEAAVDVDVSRRCLRTIDFTETSLIPLLAELVENLNKGSDSSGRAAKKAKTDKSYSAASARQVDVLIALLEATVSRHLQGSMALLVTLFDVIRLAIDLQTEVTANSEYLLQVALTLLSEVLSSCTASAEQLSQAFRADIIVDAIKVSSHNPQTFQQALLLLAKAADLSPEPVVHNVMPIFTFVGASVLQRDDSYSFSVVQQTIGSIVPPTAASMKKQAASHRQLLIASREFVRIFTDAASHVPGYRRQGFFNLLVEKLGPEDFLSAITMLLVDKAANKVAKQRIAEASSTLSLPLALVQSFDAFDQIIQEVCCLFYQTVDATLPEGQDVFLDKAGLADAESSDIRAIRKRQILSLLVFARLGLTSQTWLAALSQMGEDDRMALSTPFRSLISRMLPILTIELSPELSDLAGLLELTEGVVKGVSQAMPATLFATVILPSLDTGDARIMIKVLGLISERIGTMNRSARVTLGQDTTPIFEKVFAILRREQPDMTDELSLKAALNTLKALIGSATPAEDTQLANAIPILIAISNSPSTSKQARLSTISIIRQAAHRLGPRLIPHLSALVNFAQAHLSNSLTGSSKYHASLLVGALDILHGLFLSIPNFMSMHVVVILGQCIQPEVQSKLVRAVDGATTNSLNGLYSAMVKRLSFKHVYGAVFQVWSTLDKSKFESIGALLAFLDRALRESDKQAINSIYKPVFKFVLGVLDLRRERPADVDEKDISKVEDAAIGSFLRLVMKLNETTFKPLFLRTYDWAVIDLVEDDTAINDLGVTARRIALFKLMNGLLDQLKSIVTPYYATMLDHAIELLSAYRTGRIVDEQLWSAVVTSIGKTAEYDETGFWNTDRLKKVSGPLVDQLVRRFVLDNESKEEILKTAIIRLGETSSEEDVWQALNMAVLLKTRSEDSRARLVALRVANALWVASGDTLLLGAVPASVPFIAELLEDDSAAVVTETNVLVKRIEELLGESLDNYLT